MFRKKGKYYTMTKSDGFAANSYFLHRCSVNPCVVSARLKQVVWCRTSLPIVLVTAYTSQGNACALHCLRASVPSDYN
jgi:hypothetical protein